MTNYGLAFSVLTLLVERKFEEAGKEPPYNWYWYDPSRAWVCYLCDGILIARYSSAATTVIRDHTFNHLKDYGLLSYL